MKIVQDYSRILDQTIPWCRDLDFPFQTIVVHDSPISTMEHNNKTAKKGETTKSNLILLKKIITDFTEENTPNSPVSLQSVNLTLSRDLFKRYWNRRKIINLNIRVWVATLTS